MKRFLCTLSLLALFAGGQLFAGGAGQADADTFTPSRNIDWIVSSGAGGGSDIFTRVITDIIRQENLVNRSFMVANRIDGGGEVSRAQVSQTTGPAANHTLLTFNSGDLMPMLENTNRRSSDFRIIAVMALDKQFLYVTPQSRFQNFQQIIDAINAGERIVVGGSRGDDVVTFNLMLQENGWSHAQMPYITHNSSNEAITSILGGHVDVVVSKPAASDPFVEAGQLIPILALANERLPGNLSHVPTLGEFPPFRNVEFPTWRGVAAPAAMTPAAQAYWSNIMAQVVQTHAWRVGYMERFMLIEAFKPYREATAFVTEFEREFLANR